MGALGRSPRWWAVLCAILSRFVHVATAEAVVTLTEATFDSHLKENSRTLVEFYAPWCGHCKKLAPEYEKAAASLTSTGIPLAKVDATEAKELGTRYNVKGFPTLIWFEDGNKNEYDGGRTAEEIIEWVKSMTGPAVSDAAPQDPPADKPRVVLYADSLLPGFEAAAKALRRKAKWYFVASKEQPKVVLNHLGEAPLELVQGCGDQDKVTTFVSENILPMFGLLDGTSFDKYMEAGKGLVWVLLPMDGKTVATIQSEQRAVMTEVAKKLRGRYFLTITDTKEFKEAIDSMLSVSDFPAIAVQKTAGDKKKYVYTGEMTASSILRYVEDVDAGNVAPKLKSESPPSSNVEPVRVVVGQTLQSEVFLPDKDVLLEVYAPWCGHCKKLEPEYLKLAKKIKKEELSDFVTIAKMDGSANDSPLETLDWNGFPHIILAKAGNSTPLVYDGERTAKGLYKFFRKHATKAQEIKDRLESKRLKEQKTADL
mmetsp:Transcript_43814/g.80005  ORF Transcript_43814/g.80005 Transcript_43814/m.80005 type:complete len:483 (+) Transcript_43814:76-1524(+)